MQPTSFARRVWFIAGVVLLLLAVITIFRLAASVVMVVFAGVLLGVFLDGLARLLTEHTPLRRSAALAVVLVALVGLTSAVVLLAGPSLAGQIDRLGEQLPRALEQATSRLRDYAWGRALLESVPGGDGAQGGENAQGGESAQGGNVTSVLSALLGGVVNAVVILFIGLYLAASPRPYRNGLLLLFPSPYRIRLAETLSQTGHALRHWLVGQFAAMGIVAGFTTIGLLILGVPLAPLLGLVAGLLNFVPYVGPFLSVFPAAAVALGEGPGLVAQVAVLYGLVQFLESYVITPLIQKKAVSLPPAVLISAQVLGGVLFGALGVVLAAPLAVVLIVAVQMLYVQDVLGEEVKILGD